MDKFQKSDSGVLSKNLGRKGEASDKKKEKDMEVSYEQPAEKSTSTGQFA